MKVDGILKIFNYSGPSICTTTRTGNSFTIWGVKTLLFLTQMGIYFQNRKLNFIIGFRTKISKWRPVAEKKVNTFFLVVEFLYGEFL